MDPDEGRWPEHIRACYRGAPSVSEGRRLAAHVMAAAARVATGASGATGVAGATSATGATGATGMEPLYEKEEVMRRAAIKLGISVGKLGVGMLKKKLAARGRRDLASQAGKLNDVRKVVAHLGCLAEAVSL